MEGGLEFRDLLFLGPLLFVAPCNMTSQIKEIIQNPRWGEGVGLGVVLGGGVVWERSPWKLFGSYTF